MLIKLDDSVFYDLNYSLKEKKALDIINDIIKYGSHKIYSHPKNLMKYVENNGKDEKISFFYESLIDEMYKEYTTYNNVENFKERILIYRENMTHENDNSNIIKIKLEDVDKSFLRETVVITEGSDEAFINLILDDYLKYKGIKLIRKYESRIGGGSATLVQNIEKILQKVFIYVVCDSDRIYPKQSHSKAVSEMKNLEKNSKTLKLRVIEREIENIVSLHIWEEFLELKHEFLKDLEKKEEYQYLKFFDFKKGITNECYEKDREFTKFWIKKTSKKPIKSLFSKDKNKIKKIIENKSQLENKEKTGNLSQEEKRKLDSIRNLFSNPQISKFYTELWKEICEEIICWTIGDQERNFYA